MVGTFHDSGMKKKRKEKEAQEKLVENRTKVLTKRCGHELVAPCHIHVANEKKAVTKIVPRRPNNLFSGSVSQQPRMAQQS